MTFIFTKVIKAPDLSAPLGTSSRTRRVRQSPVREFRLLRRTRGLGLGDWGGVPPAQGRAFPRSTVGGWTSPGSCGTGCPPALSEALNILRSCIIYIHHKSVSGGVNKDPVVGVSTCVERRLFAYCRAFPTFGTRRGPTPVNSS